MPTGFEQYKLQHTYFHTPACLASSALPSCLFGVVSQVACQATATVVFLDEKYKPVRVPGEVKQMFSTLNAEYKAPEQ
jgi:acyl-CoA thioesterase FadM